MPNNVRTYDIRRPYKQDKLLCMLDRSIGVLETGYVADREMQVAMLVRLYERTFAEAGLPDPFKPWPCS